MKRLRERLQTRLEEEGYELVIEEDAGSDMVKKALNDCWNKIELTQAQAIAAANILSDAQLEALQFKNTPLTPEEKLDYQKTLLFKWFGQELIKATTYEHDSGEILTGYAAMALKNERGVYRQQLENFYLLILDEGEAISKDIATETSQLKYNQGRFPGDIRWRSRQRKARAWLGLPQFLDPEQWYEPNDYRAMGQKAKSKAPMIKDCLNLTVEKISDGQIFAELMRQLGLELDKEWASVKTGQRRFKRRRISAESWRFAQMYVEYQNQIKTEKKTSTLAQLSQPEVCQSDHPPQNIYTDSFFRGGVITEESQVEQVEMLTQCSDGSITTNAEVVAEIGDNVACANLITPPRIYIQTPFLGGGDQDSSQGIAEALEVADPVQELSEVLSRCESPDDFIDVAEGCSVEVIEAAIAITDTQTKRKQLDQWSEELAAAGDLDMSQDFAEQRSLTELLSKAIGQGKSAVRKMLQELNFSQRWTTISDLEELMPEEFAYLLSLIPDLLESSLLVVQPDAE
jgi:hypothetical protein